MVFLESFNPVNGELVGKVPVTAAEDIPAVVAQARAAQANWASLGLEGRKAALKGAAARIREHADEIGRQLTMEMGKPLSSGVGEVLEVAGELVNDLDELVAALAPERFEDGRTISTMYYEPHGVCVAITPWNFPFAMPHWMVIPALMAGNTVILKPSEETPLSGQAYVDYLAADLPEGVLQVVHGADEQGKALVASDVDLIAFTGSREVGKLILGEAVHDLKRVILELGGKDPMLVLDDADISRAARFAANNSFRNAGQVCVSTERIYVSDAIADEFVEALVKEAKAMVVGNGLDEGTEIGPMVSARQRSHVEGQVAAAIEDGARLLTGGEVSDVGHFMQPTVLDGVSHAMDIAMEETFGPVAAVIRVQNEEEAVSLANDTPFGLGATVFGVDEEHAEFIARRIQAGMVSVNRAVGGAQGTPWVGARQSGYGFHKSTAGHRQFAQVRVVSKRAPRKNS